MTNIRRATAELVRRASRALRRFADNVIDDRDAEQRLRDLLEHAGE